MQDVESEDVGRLLEGRTMMEDAVGRELHDRATRGLALAPEEQARLDEWYRQKDAEEARMLEASAAPAIPPLETLREEVEAVLSRLTKVTERVEALSQENERLRRELETFRTGERY